MTLTDYRKTPFPWAGGKADAAPAVWEAVAAHLARQHPRPLPVDRVRLVRLGERALDTDNLAGALKAVRDAVAAWIGVDDGIRGGIVWEVDQEPHKRHRNQPGVRIELYRKETP